MQYLHKATFLFLVLGGVNMLLDSFGFGLARFVGNGSILQVVYIIVGLSAVYQVATHKAGCKECSAKKAS